MKRIRELGYCQVTTGGGGSWHLQRDQYAAVRHAWLEGAKHVDAIGFHGDKLTIRLIDVDSVNDLSPESIRESINEARADAADDSLAGGAA